MQSIIYAFIGTILYAMTGVVIEQKLEKFNTPSLVFLFMVPMIPIALVWIWAQKSLHQQVNFPSGTAFWLVMVLGVLYYFADYFYIGAFTSGGNVLTITTIVLIAPAIASIIKYYWVGGKPSALQVGGYLCIVAGMLLITKGTK